jgi:cell division septation protein DedD
LIIYGTAQEFQNIKNILKDLDIIPRQVLIDALILQVDMRDVEQLGVDYEIIRQRTTIFGQTYRSLGALRSLGGLFSDANAVGAITNLGGTAIVGGSDVQAMIRALASDSRVKVISSPSVLAADNRPARIQVGSEEPIPTGTVSTPGANVTNQFTTSTTIQYRNTGRILTIIPQVNSQGLVHLQVKAEVSARGDDVTVGNQSFPAFNTQDAETTAIVQDGETLVIGGLIGERTSRVRSGLPYLMSIPIIGRLFRTETDDTNRTELIMLITPRVIRSREESRTVTEDFKNKLGAVRNELDRMRGDRERDLQRQRMLRQPLPPPATQVPQGDIPIQPPQPPPAVQSPPQQPLPPKQSGVPLTSDTHSVPTMPSMPVNANPPAAAPQVQGSVVTQPTLPPVSVAAPSQAGVPTTSVDIQMTTPVRESSQTVVAGLIGPPNVPVASDSVPGPIDTLLDAIESNNAIVSNNAEAQKIASLAPQPAKASVWVIQVASYDREGDAQAYANKLKRDGYDAYVSIAITGSRTRYRVEVGPLDTRNEALAMQKNLRDGQHSENSLVLSKALS